MPDVMMFPDTVEEFMESYKMVDVEHVYSNGVEFVPIYRMMQWFQHRPERKTGDGALLTRSNIREFRKKAGLSQRELAKRSGLSSTTIQGYEQGRFRPKIEALLKIADALDAEIEYSGMRKAEREERLKAEIARLEFELARIKERDNKIVELLTSDKA